ncbi:class I mannose-6-phosphate isomerase [Auraticoccus monumenti]|uniref:Mannose-6-phosphate isomerase, class I n=1 Tax=Auraticoccus monumenti TaxID=675864 RepID=A0A1G6Z002_9ACTN|nr:class I mannose-6-phosphate isomerase [Auraticoccus monumenti]SDD95237.1 Mannose-6-phosphate isomerase, class I [Auraticoccus monumenti]
MTVTGYGNYDRHPRVVVPGDGHRLWSGADAFTYLAERLRTGPARVLVVDCYPGVDVAAVRDGLLAADPGLDVVDVEEAALEAAELDRLLADELTGDRVFGVLSRRRLAQLYHPDRLEHLRRQLAAGGGRTAVVGWGASLVAPADALVVLADLPRWEIQQRYRAGLGNWRAGNGGEDVLRKYKRGYFVEWRVADEHKRPLLERADFLLDTTTSRARLIAGDTLRAGLAAAASRPFRVVPFFDPGPWGGTWMERVLGLEPLDGQQYAWGFDCVPEENSLLLGVDGDVVEVPSQDLVLTHPRELLGERTFARFGAEFPIRFDLLDTVGGGNLSLQVHPTTDYIQRTFAMPYTQDESYYLLDAEPGARVHLGLREGVDPARLREELEAGQRGEEVDVDALVATFPARRHDHFLIPAGTVHASGAGSMVLEVSATPFIFTFKLWDWGRLGLDGRPRPIHLEHGMANIDPRRDTAWAARTAVDQTRQVDSGPGWAEERTGLHELEFIETRRHRFTGAVDHDTRGTVHVLNLVEGEEVVVDSPEDAFPAVVVHYAETFIVPAAVGRYRVTPSGEGPWATLRASVRGTDRWPADPAGPATS